ncbi:TPA: tyrosine-type recombinase/integrase [Corynebacterium striatum]|nr:tyrosine-type recombinase/integrase [Corynebacterium striatum]NHY11003.1 hypothetical protein [Corynebacterium striatum]NHY35423.1 hypothetical protein [Corynebacterium striatum]HAT1132016.1 tyrosine-type recombinase/integrase [Corynebacterium striatum]HAT1139968.1 tyrosine-type recombinase/integrase [Corynebacterium striatum]HAT1142313.1 tyrosine-type recombinase/integrase [Corynebacterium striatum]
MHEDWETLLSRFEKSQTVEGISTQIRTQRRGHLVKFARSFELSPDKVRTSDLQGYLDKRRIKTATRRNYVKSFRAFWRWQQETGYRFDNPAIDLKLTFTASEERDQDRRAAANDDPRQYGPQPRELPTEWSKLLTDWTKYARAGGTPESTLKTRLSHLRNLVKFLENTAPELVTLDDLIEWMIRKDWAPETKRLARSSVKGFFEWAVLAGRLTHDPSHGLPKVKGTVGIPRPATESSYQFALVVAKPRERLMLRLAAELGLRRAEVASIHSRDIIELEHCRALVINGKGRKERILPLTDSIYSDLQEFGPGWIFPSKSKTGHITPHYVGKLVSSLLPEGVTMHKLRHRFATVAYDQTGDVLAVQQVLGHSSPATTQRYVALSQRKTEELMSKVGDISNPATRPLNISKSQ